MPQVVATSSKKLLWFLARLTAAVATAIIAYAIFLIKKLADTVIRGEESAKELVDETIIGDIPNWTNTDKSAKEENKK